VIVCAETSEKEGGKRGQGQEEVARLVNEHHKSCFFAKTFTAAHAFTRRVPVMHRQAAAYASGCSEESSGRQLGRGRRRYWGKRELAMTRKTGKKRKKCRRWRINVAKGGVEGAMERSRCLRVDSCIFNVNSETLVLDNASQASWRPPQRCRPPRPRLHARHRLRSACGASISPQEATGRRARRARGPRLVAASRTRRASGEEGAGGRAPEAPRILCRHAGNVLQVAKNAVQF
jgi:hypothetical protein